MNDDDELKELRERVEKMEKQLTSCMMMTARLSMLFKFPLELLQADAARACEKAEREKPPPDGMN